MSDINFFKSDEFNAYLMNEYKEYSSAVGSRGHNVKSSIATHNPHSATVFDTSTIVDNSMLSDNSSGYSSTTNFNSKINSASNAKNCNFLSEEINFPKTEEKEFLVGTDNKPNFSRRTLRVQGSKYNFLLKRNLSHDMYVSSQNFCLKENEVSCLFI